MNYFDPKAAAERYAKGRPNFHSNTVRHIGDFLQLNKKVDNALDIACGTGLSTKALLEIAENVYGTDISQEMLNLAPQHERILYSIAPADQQPFTNQYFDLLTVSSGVHWFNIDKFLVEVDRLLKSRGWLVLYENHFISEMVGNDSFSKWFPEVYVKKFPSPPRNNDYPWTNANLSPRNFHLVSEERFKNAVTFTRKHLALYFTTQSNIIAAVERREVTYEETETWLNQELVPFFENDDTIQIIHYGNWIKFIQKAN